MSQTYERHGRRHPWLRRIAYRVARPFIKWHSNLRGFYDSDHCVAGEKLTALQSKIERGETAYIVGLGLAGHNSGTALIEASNRGIRFIANNEEERYTQITDLCAVNAPGYRLS